MTTDPAPSPAPTVSVVIAAFSHERWDDLVAAVASVRTQSLAPRETVVVIDHNPRLLARARAELTSALVMPNVYAQGASGARNTGVAATSSQVVAFMDDDATAAPDWLERLVEPFDDPTVVGVAGRLEPAWSSSRPSWFAPEFDWVIGSSYRGLPDRVAPTRNAWSNNMAIRRDVFDAVGGFRVGFGKVGDRSRPEDTDLCLRAATAREGGRWMFHPNALAYHKVPPSRETFRFFVRRCYAEGQGKSELGRLLGGAATSAEKGYAFRVLPKGVAAAMVEALRGDPTGLARVGVIGLGLAVTSAGFARHRVFEAPLRSRAPEATLRPSRLWRKPRS